MAPTSLPGPNVFHCSTDAAQMIRATPQMAKIVRTQKASGNLMTAPPSLRGWRSASVAACEVVRLQLCSLLHQ
jgi:hypothetical protein